MLTLILAITVVTCTDTLKIFLPGKSRGWISARNREFGPYRDKNSIYEVDVNSIYARETLHSYITRKVPAGEERNYFRKLLDHRYPLRGRDIADPEIRLHLAPSLEIKEGTADRPLAYRLTLCQLKAILAQGCAVDKYGSALWNDDSTQCNTSGCHPGHGDSRLPFPVCAALEEKCSNCLWTESNCGLRGNIVAPGYP